MNNIEALLDLCTHHRSDRSFSANRCTCDITHASENLISWALHSDAWVLCIETAPMMHPIDEPHLAFKVSAAWCRLCAICVPITCTAKTDLHTFRQSTMLQTSGCCGASLSPMAPAYSALHLNHKNFFGQIIQPDIEQHQPKRIGVHTDQLCGRLHLANEVNDHYMNCIFLKDA